MLPRWNARRRVSVAAAAAIALVGGGLVHSPVTAHADTLGIAADQLRTGWFPNQPQLTPQVVGGTNFGQIFNATVTGQVYAQPLISQGTLLVATESNFAYGLDPLTGHQRWSLSLGVGWTPTCADFTPTVGVTATPVIDPATNIAYLTSKTYASGTSGVARWNMHAINVATGVEQAGFPVAIQGTAANDPTHVFDPDQQLQRPGLLLLNGVVYAGFGSHCDLGTYEGWIAGVSTAGRLTTMWTDEAGKPAGSEGGIWQSGGGLMSDGSGQIIVASGNGEGVDVPTPGKTPSGGSPPGALGQTVMRLNVQPDGTLKNTDFFRPFNADLLNTCDCDLGSGAPAGLPDSMGTATHPHLLVQVGKSGYLYLLDRDNLGGFQQGAGQSDAVAGRAGPDGGVWGKPGVWPGDGGYVYVTTAAQGGKSGFLRAYKYGVDGAGNPTLARVGSSTDAFGFASSSPVITSDGTKSGSALVWVIYRPTTAGAVAQLRAYDPIPVNGVMNVRFSVPIGQAAKFLSPMADNNHIFIGTRDGKVYCYGSPVTAAVSGPAVTFPDTITGNTSTLTETVTANADLSVTGIGSSGAPFALGSGVPSTPFTVTAGQTFNVPLKFSPTEVGPAGGTLTVTTSAGVTQIGLTGRGLSATALLDATPGALILDNIATGTTESGTITFTNDGAQPLTINSATPPAAPFSVAGLPAVGSVIAAGASVSVQVTFAPTVKGPYASTVSLTSTGGDQSVDVSATASTPGHLTVTPLSVGFGTLSVGSSATAYFNVSNTGGTGIDLTISKPPDLHNGFTALTALAEGSPLPAGASLTEAVRFAPLAAGAVADSWKLNSDDGNPAQFVNFTGTGSLATHPGIYTGDVTVVRPASGTTTAVFPITLSSPSASTITASYRTTDGTATAAAGDYVAVPSTTVTFNPGETSKTVAVTVNPTVRRLGNRTFNLALSNPTNANLSDGGGAGLILDPLGPYAISVSDASVSQPATGTTATEHFAVSLPSAPAVGDTVSVTVATADGTATAGNGNYNAVAAKVLTFTNATGPTQDVPVTVNPKSAPTANTTFQLRLSKASTNAVIADTAGQGTIITPGGPAMPSPVYVSDATVVAPASGGQPVNATFVVTLGAPQPAPVQIRCVTNDATATAAAGDYIGTPAATITFAANQTSLTLPIQVPATGKHGGNIAFTMHCYKTLTTNAVLADGDGTGTIISPLGPDSVYIQDTSTKTSHTTSSTAVVTLSLAAPVAAGETVTATVATADGAATVANGDYTALPPTVVTFLAGQQTAQVSIVVKASPTAKPTRSFVLNVTAVSADAYLSDSHAVVTISSNT